MGILVILTFPIYYSSLSLAAAAVAVSLQMRDREGAVEESFGDADSEGDNHM